MPASRDPIFQRMARGDTREQVLGAFRLSLRDLVDPTTGSAWDEDTIRQATMQGSRFWTEAESDDLIVQAFQKRAEFLTQQVDPRRASSAWLEGFHGPALGSPRLDASGGSGSVLVTGVLGAAFVGSTTIPDSLATRGTDQSGNRYQVLFSANIPASGEAASVIVQGIDVGPATNLLEGAVITWTNPPAGADLTGTVELDFTGGTSVETDQEWGERLFTLRGKRPKGGNPAQMRAWAREATNAIEDAFVYPCALDSGSVLVVCTQKRANVVGPLARIPSVGTMTVVAGRIVTPSSPLVPARAYVLAVAAVAEPVELALGLPLRKGSRIGWADPAPWPTFETASALINSSVAPTQSTFRMTADTTFPPVGIPQLMVWNGTISQFEKLSVASVTGAGPSYTVTLTGDHPGKTLAVGDVVSPYTSRHAEIARGVTAYFDSLGPGEAFDLSTDARAGRAYRRPRPERERSYRFDATILDYVEDAMGVRFFGEELLYQSLTEPTLRIDLSTGVGMLVAGGCGVYPV